MGKYTAELLDILMTLDTDSDEFTEFPDVESLLDNTVDKVFNFYFPIFDEDYRRTLEKKILRHYLTREIGQETYGLWKLKLMTKLNEIMPYYNKLYESELLEFNPLFDIDLTKSGNREKGGEDTSTLSGKDTLNNTGTTTTTQLGSVTHDTEGSIIDTAAGTDTDTLTKSGSETNERSVTGDLEETHTDAYSDTPEGNLTNVSTNAYLSAYDYKTDKTSDGRVIDDTLSFSQRVDEMKKEKDSSNTRTFDEYSQKDTYDTENGTDVDLKYETTYGKKNTKSYGSTDEYLEHLTGRKGVSGSKLLKEFRDTFLNIDMAVIMELKDLFIKLW